MALKNCWEVMKCRRQPGGKHVSEFGVCPAALTGGHNGVNRGKNCGRFCWAIAGTMCRGEVQGTYAQKAMKCIKCDFFKRVQDEESNGFVFSVRDIKK